MGNRVTAWPMVVPFQALIHITRCSDVVSRRVDVATQHVNEPVSDSSHAYDMATVRPRTKVLTLRTCFEGVSSFCVRGIGVRLQELKSAFAPSSRRRCFGE